jgi:hypothetical protein
VIEWESHNRQFKARRDIGDVINASHKDERSAAKSVG